MLKLFGFVSAVALLCFVQDFSRNSAEANQDSVRKLKSDLGVPVVKFLVCNSWGYKQAFEQYAQMIQQRYSGVKIEGGNYPPPMFNQYMAQLISLLKFVAIACIVSGVNPFVKLNYETPSVFTWAQENKIYACMMLFFICNALESSFISTGAFEILLNEKTIWSKLQSGRVPRPEELLEIIDSNINVGQLGGNNF